MACGFIPASHYLCIMGVIYKITNPKGRLYVGKTYCLRKRINSHKHNAKKDSNIILANSIKKYGWDAHTIEVIEAVEDYKLDEREIFWIKELKTYCYEYYGQMNMTLGGEGQRSTWKHDTARVLKAREMSLGDKNNFFGKSHSDESKKIMSAKVSERNIRNGVTVPKWGVEKGRLKRLVPVIMYNKDGNFEREFESVAEAACYINSTHSSISESCNHKISNSGGYIFRYKTEKYSLKIEVESVSIKTEARPVICFVGSYCIEYDKAETAAKELGIPKTTINRAALRSIVRPIRKGYVFIYKDLYEKIKQVS